MKYVHKDKIASVKLKLAMMHYEAIGFPAPSAYIVKHSGPIHMVRATGHSSVWRCLLDLIAVLVDNYYADGCFKIKAFQLNKHRRTLRTIFSIVVKLIKIL